MMYKIRSLIPPGPTQLPVACNKVLQATGSGTRAWERGYKIRLNTFCVHIKLMYTVCFVHVKNTVHTVPILGKTGYCFLKVRAACLRSAHTSSIPITTVNREIFTVKIFRRSTALQCKRVYAQTISLLSQGVVTLVTGKLKR